MLSTHSATRTQVLGEDEARIQSTRHLVEVTQEAAGVLEQLGGRQRDLLATDHVFRAQLEARLGPEQELVERRQPVEHPTCAEVTSPSKKRSSPRRKPRTSVSTPVRREAASARTR